MDKIRIMHIADYHLGLEFPFLGRLSETRKKEMINSFKDLLKKASLEKINILLIAGDFLEATYVSADLIKEIKEQFARRDFRVFIVAGNHDYISLSSPYLDDDWPDNVHIFKTSKLEKVALEDLGVNIYGASFTATYEKRGIIFPEDGLDGQLINILLLHGDIAKNSVYNPIDLDEIARAGFDYLALGHIHKKSGILKKVNTHYAYPGSAFAMNFAEVGRRQAILGDFSKLEKRLDYIDLDSPMMLEEYIDIGDVADTHGIIAKIRDVLVEKYDDHRDHYYRIKLIGELEEGYDFDMSLIEAGLSDLNYLELSDDTRIALDIDSLKNDLSLKGLFIKKILEKQDEAKARGDLNEFLSLEMAMEKGLRALEGRRL